MRWAAYQRGLDSRGCLETQVRWVHETYWHADPQSRMVPPDGECTQLCSTTKVSLRATKQVMVPNAYASTMGQSPMPSNMNDDCEVQ